jgi:hypothetical protein
MTRRFDCSTREGKYCFARVALHLADIETATGQAAAAKVLTRGPNEGRDVLPRRGSAIAYQDLVREQGGISATSEGLVFSVSGGENRSHPSIT